MPNLVTAVAELWFGQGWFLSLTRSKIEVNHRFIKASGTGGRACVYFGNALLPAD
jgi:hypothetical protein